MLVQVAFVGVPTLSTCAEPMCMHKILKLDHKTEELTSVVCGMLTQFNVTSTGKK